MKKILNFKRLVYLPEWDSCDIWNYSGTPFFLYEALRENLQKKGIEFCCIDTKEIINTEDIWKYAQQIVSQKLWVKEVFENNMLGIRDYRLLFWINTKLLEALIAARTLENCLVPVKKYHEEITQFVQAKIDEVYQNGDVVLSINTLNPNFDSSKYRTFFYLDIPLWHFYFQNPGYIGLPEIPEIQSFYFEMEQDALIGCSWIFGFSQACLKLIWDLYSVSSSKMHRVFAWANISPDERKVRFHKSNVSNFLFIGKDFENKWGPFLLEAFRKEELKKMRLTIVTESRYIEKYREEGDSNILYHPVVEKEKIIQLYKEHDVFIFPTHMDPFWLVVCEAMTFWMPVIGSDFFAIPEILWKFSQHLCFAIRNADSIRQKVLFLKNSTPTFLDEVSKYNARRASVVFTWNRVAKNIIFNIQEYDGE